MYDGGNGCEGLKARYEAFKDANKRLKPEEIDDRWNAALREPGNTDLYQAWITHHKGAKEAASQPVQVDRKAAFSRATTALVNGTPIAPNDYNALDTEQRKELVRLRAKSKAATQTGAH